MDGSYFGGMRERIQLRTNACAWPSVEKDTFDPRKEKERKQAYHFMILAKFLIYKVYCQSMY